MSKRVNLSSVDYKRSIRRAPQMVAALADMESEMEREAKGRILLTQVNNVKKSTTFRRKDFASIATQLQNRGVAWNPMSETMRMSSVKPPKYSKDDV